MELSERLASLSPAKRKLLEQKLKEKKTSVAEPVAIVGMGCRFPGASGLDQFWQLIVDGVDATGEIPPERWDVDKFYDPDFEAAGKMSTRWGGFVDHVDEFDPLFFGITPREAARMDPQQRLLLEVTWEAIENAGIAADQMAGTRTGVYVGIGGTDYSKIPSQFDNYYEHLDAHIGTGNALSIAANRLSYILDFHGPSMAIDTACSSGLLGIHLAVQALRHGECDAAVAGGVNLILSPETTIAFSKARMLSPEGKCRPFDAGANGYVRGEGCGMVVLKRLTDALNDGDHVLAIMRGTAVNQDGRTSGITAPNGVSQQRVIHTALAQAGITTDQINYIEAHGTGTPLGDPIELGALSKIYANKTENDPPVHVGSVKAHIGHTETVSGVAGVIKTVMMMQHRVIPKQLYLEEINPHISTEGTRIKFPMQETPWTVEGGTRMAGVSSFGFGGTNVHVIVEEAAAPKPAVDAAVDAPRQLLTLSAKTATALTSLAGRYADRLQEEESTGSLAEICYEANNGRARFNHRLALVAADRDAAMEKLAAVAAGKTPAGVKVSQVRAVGRPKVAMLFTGQGSQYVEMGRTLYETEPLFRQTLEQCDEFLSELMDESLIDLLFSEGGEERLNETAYTQPALFAIEYSLARLWQSWGIQPDILLGHSVGEYVAACIAGVFSLADGLRLIATRGRLMQQQPPGGAMAAVFAAEADVRPVVEKHAPQLDIAAFNGPQNTVISGTEAAVDAAMAEFEKAGVGGQKLAVSHAFHSHLMDSMLDEFRAAAEEIEYAAPKIPIASNLTGEILTGKVPDAEYWCQHIRQAVRFAEGMQLLADSEIDIMLEAGPAPILLGMGRRVLAESKAAWLPSLRKGQEDLQVMLGSLADLYLAGVKVDLSRLGRRSNRSLSLPTYPFERTSHWYDEKLGGARTTSAARGLRIHPLLGSHVPTAQEGELFENRLSDRDPKYLADHVVQGSVVVPAAAFVELGLAAAKQLFGEGSHAVEDLSIQHAMFVPEGMSRTVQVSLSPELGGTSTFHVHSMLAGEDTAAQEWTMHATGVVRHGDSVREDESRQPITMQEVEPRLFDPNTRDEFYAIMAARLLTYGPAFRALEHVNRSDDEALGVFGLADSVVAELDQYDLHPALLDGLVQTIACTIPFEPDQSYSPSTYMPTSIRRARKLRPLTESMHAYAVRTSEDSSPSPDSVTSDLFLLNDDGEVLVELLGVTVTRLQRGGGLDGKKEDVRDWLYQVDWQSAPLDVSVTKKTPATDAPWLVFADAQGIGKGVAESLKTAGARVVLVEPGDGFASPTEGNGSSGSAYRVDPLSQEDHQRLFAETLGGDAPSCAGVVHLWSLDTPALDAEGSLPTARQLGVGSLLQLTKQLARTYFRKAPPVWIATQNAQAVHREDDVSAAGTALWGFARVAALEHPELCCRLIDLDETADVTDCASALAAELAATDEPGSESYEDQIALRGGERFVARLASRPEVLSADSTQAAALSVPVGGAFRLRLVDPGDMDSLRLESFVRKQPAKGAVELEIRATGLNFSDVLKAMGLYPGITDEIVPLGIECAGVVTAIGEGVDRFKVGDEVMGVVPYSFASHGTTMDYAVVEKPSTLTFEEAATVPITFLTAYYGLIQLAHMEPGERVLIHAGAGGVGLSAIQIAQHIGAEVFATAGSDEKRDYLRSLGVKHVFNSRTLDFAEEILELTDREGVDIVLNSLPGEAIPKSLGILRAYGRFLEIGKTDIYMNRMIGLLPFQDNLSYHAIDLDRMFRQKPAAIRRLYDEVMPFFGKGGPYRALPFTKFAAEKTIDAFRYMAQRKNIGKVVVSLDTRASEASDDEAVRGPIHSEGTYLITGGLGALGRRVAEWLVASGAKHIAVMSRRKPSGEPAEWIEQMNVGGAKVVAVQGDVVDAASLEKALTGLRKKMPPLVGVFHAAGVLDDGVLFDMDLAQLDRAMSPKFEGAWNLHALTADDPLELFVFFSSIACVLGSPGQANYAAGNAFLDGLAQYRRHRELPAASVNWGPWADSGMAATSGRDAGLDDRGMNLLDGELAMKVLGGLQQSSEQVAVMSVRWREMAKQYRGKLPPLLRNVAPADGDADDAADDAADDGEDSAFRAELLAADDDARAEKLREYFTDRIAHIMGLEPESLDVEQPLNTLGLDSLMAIELKNSIETRLKVVLPMARFMEGPSVNSLSGYVAESMGDDSGAALVAVVAAEETGRQPLARGQQALWFLHQLAPESTAYNICDAVRVRGDLNFEVLVASVQSIVDRHAAFRTTFHDDDGLPYAEVHKTREAAVELIDAIDWDDEQIRQRVTGEIHHHFDLEHGPLLRVAVLKRSATEHVLAFVVHHIISDFWSLVMCTDEFRHGYEAISQGREAKLPEVKVNFSDFTRWQAEMLDSAEGEAQWNYWKEQLAGELPMLGLPTDRPRPPVQTFNGDLAFRFIKPDTTEKLRELAESHGTTMHSLLLAVYQVLLSRYTGQKDILVGAPTSGRTRADFAQVVGFFVNPVVVRGDLAGDPSFADFLIQIRDRMLGALEHQDYPLPLLVKKLHVERDPSRSPLVQAMFVMQKAHIMHDEGLTPFLMGQEGASLGIADLKFESMTLAQWIAQFELSLAASEANGGLSLGLQYNTDLFDASTMERMLDHLEMLLADVVADPTTSVARLALLTDEEQQQLCVEFNDTDAKYDDASMMSLIEQQAKKQAKKVAVVTEDGQWTYAELNARANQVAHFLAEQGAGRGTIVGVHLDRTLDLFAGLLGILKCGAAYLPLDPQYPAERRTLMLDDAKAAFVLTDERTGGDLPACTSKVINIDDEAKAIDACSTKNLAVEIDPEDMAYMIYTSGSTGRPKGVMVPHRGARNLMESFAREPGLNSNDVLLAITTICFDISVIELYLPLTQGGTVVLAGRDVSVEGEQLAGLIEQHNVTVLQATPATFRILLTSGWKPTPSLKLLSGGEALDPDLGQQLMVPDGELWNCYGPTETTVWSTLQRVTEIEPNMSIGQPIDNTQIYILDEAGQIVPTGVPGELCIGGDGVALGYWERPELTDDRFIDDPFRKTVSGKLYRTGDLARWMPDGRLQCLGRMDGQIKIRGFRVELGEIEAALAQHESLQEVAVVAHGDGSGHLRLVAYVVAEQGATVTIEQLRDFLGASLPDYMVPSIFVTMDELPQTGSGKINRKALPVPDLARPELSDSFVAPRNDTERKLVEIWEDVLGVRPVGVNDNFFELGGHSLMAVQIGSRIGTELGISLPIRSLFEHTSVSSVARAIDEGTATDTGADEIVLEEEVSLEESITADGAAAPDTTQPKNILLTGTSGFVGCQLLVQLLATGDATVHCLLTAHDQPEAEAKLRKALEAAGVSDLDWDRIVPVVGRSTREYFGLSESAFAALADSVDCIVHAGETRNFNYPYPMLQPANVESTREVLRLATTGKIKPLHLLSSLDSLGLNTRTDEVRLESDSLASTAGLVSGYSQTKWVAERIAMLARERGLPVSIYRCGRITGNSKTGASDHGDLVSQLLKGFVEFGSAPEVEMSLDLSPVDFVATALAKLVYDTKTECATYHLRNPEGVSWQDIVGSLTEFGYPIRLVSPFEWQQEVFEPQGEQQIEAAKSLGPLFTEAARAGTLGDMTYQAKVDTAAADAKLGTAGGELPAGRELLARYLTYYVASGYLAAPE